MAILKYTLVFQQYGQAQQVNLGGCNSIVFFNTGTATAFIEGCPITPGAQISIEGNACEVSEDVLQLTFDLTAGLVQSMTTIKKSYTGGYSQILNQ
jgi:hypothetical protein